MQNCTCCQSCGQNQNKIKRFLKTCRKPQRYEQCERMSENVRNQCKIAHVVNHVHKAHVKWHVSENVESHGQTCENQCKIAQAVNNVHETQVNLHVF